MLSFRGRTFCIADCAFAGCPFRLTPHVIAAADCWWGGPGGPIAMADLRAGCLDFLDPEAAPRAASPSHPDAPAVAPAGVSDPGRPVETQPGCDACGPTQRTAADD